MATHESTGFTVSFATVEKALLKMHASSPSMRRRGGRGSTS